MAPQQRKAKQRKILIFVENQDFLFSPKMQKSVADSSDIKRLLLSALTDKINDRETFMKGIDYSYYYEQEGL